MFDWFFVHFQVIYHPYMMPDFSMINDFLRMLIFSMLMYVILELVDIINVFTPFSRRVFSCHGF